MHPITPFLWFDSQAEEAARFYTSIFEDSKILQTTHYGEGGPGPAGSVMTVSFQLRGQRFTALNGGPHYKFTPAVSLVVECETQQEIDRFWTALTEGGGQPVQCGWLTDRYGLSWQVVPRQVAQWLSDADPARAARVMAAVMTMVKLDLARMKQAYEQG